jgi:hypothetical protein
MEDLLAWHVYDLQHRNGSSMKEPSHPRPPQVEQIWHNAFHDQVQENLGDIEDALTASGAILEGAGLIDGVETDFLRAADLRRGLATSVSEGIELSKRARLEPLGIKVNADFGGGELALVRDKPQKIKLGSLEFTVLGPFEADLENLRKEWNKWLGNNKAAVKRLRAKMDRDAARLTTGELTGFEDAVEASALELDTEVHDEEDRELGNRSKVTVPNLASLMVLAEEGRKTVLLTGDGSQKDILKGLEEAGRLDAKGRIHVDVLKVQHHGSEHNVDKGFLEKVTADHYVFCANGEHENPDEDVVKVLLGARDGDRYKLWFNSSADAARESGDPDHMEKIETLVRGHAAASGDRVECTFLARGESFFDVPV